MPKRKRMGRRQSRKVFKKGYNRVNSKNRWNRFMRGGIRL